VKRNLREHLVSASATAGLIGLVAGYAVVGVFTRD
jgi:hypothetical protein